MTRMSCAIALSLAMGGLLLTGPMARGADYPTRPVRMIVPFPPGGSTDILARLIAQKLTERLAQQVIVDNRGGAGGLIGMELAARAAPDGYTLLVSSSITHTVSASLHKKAPFDPIKDFAPITMAASAPLMLVVNPAVPAKSVQELVALAKAKPGELNYASPGNGTSGHLAAEMFRMMTGVNIVHVPYKGGGPALTGLVAGQVQMLIISVVAALPHVKSGRLRALGLTSVARSPDLPDIPTVAESGAPGYEVVLWYGVFAPASTPRERVARLNAETASILRAPEMKERLAADGGRPVGNSPEEFLAIVRSDVAKWAKVVKAAGIRAE